MKLAFACSSLEPGRDGVGDYTRALARECMAQQHECCTVALNDPFVSEPTESEDRDSGLKMLRLPSVTSWEQRVAQAAAFAASFEPDWVSLQFVCFGFHPKGLVFFLAKKLVPLFTAGQCHIMFHELWIGESKGYGPKNGAVGLLQKWGVLRLLRKLRPALMHTSNPAYVELLARNGAAARELPLPGNIPVVEAETGVLEAIARGNGLGLDASSRDAWWVAGVFGTIHPEWTPARWLEQLCDLAGENRKRLLFLHLGHTSDSGTMLWKNLAKDYTGRCDFLELGRQSPMQVSRVMQNLDFSIATSPWALIGKSGSTAAMLDHGLPVLVTRDDWKLRRGTTPEPTAHPLLHRFDPKTIGGLPDWIARKKPPQPRLPEIARAFLHDLEESEKCFAKPVLA